MTSRTATIHNSYGIHCRPAGVIAKQARQYEADIQIDSGDGNKVAASNIMGLLTLGLSQGNSVQIEVDGPDEERIADEIRDLFEKKI